MTPPQPHRATARRAGRRHGRSVAQPDLQKARAADVRDQRARRHVGERLAERGPERALAPGDLDLRVGPHQVGGHRRQQIAEAIDMGHAPLDAVTDLAHERGIAARPASARAGRRPPRTRPPRGDPPSARRRPGRERWGSPARAGSRPHRCGRPAAARAATSESTPLSGPTKNEPPDATTTSARAPPTPGSTTATWIVPRGNSGAACARAIAPPAMSCGAMPWVTSTSRASGASDRTTPFMAPT